MSSSVYAALGNLKLSVVVGLKGLGKTVKANSFGTEMSFAALVVSDVVSIAKCCTKPLVNPLSPGWMASGVVGKSMDNVPPTIHKLSAFST